MGEDLGLGATLKLYKMLIVKLKKRKEKKVMCFCVARAIKPVYVTIRFLTDIEGHINCERSP